MNIMITGIDLSDNKSVLLIAPEHLDENDCIAVSNALKANFPGCEFVILSGEFQVVTTTPKTPVYELEA